MHLAEDVFAHFRVRLSGLKLRVQILEVPSNPIYSVILFGIITEVFTFFKDEFSHEQRVHSHIHDALLQSNTSVLKIGVVKMQVPYKNLNGAHSESVNKFLIVRFSWQNSNFNISGENCNISERT